jgi:hypothetical protein
MTELTPTLPLRPSHVLITLARLAAKNAAKEQLRAQGLKPQLMRASEINAVAKLYLTANARALLEEAWRKRQRCPDLMRFTRRRRRIGSGA